MGQGGGDSGTPIGSSDEAGPGDGTAGDQPGEHILEVEIPLEELAEIMGEELELPRIQPRGKKNIIEEKDRYTGIRRVGPESLRHFKRTYKQALKRQIISGNYNSERPRIIPIREDKRYLSWKTTRSPESNAVIIYMMDVSGSMGDEQKEIVRIESFWIDTWLRFHYKGLESRYIVHDATAREVDRDTFYHTRESGGTLISSAYELCVKIIESDYSPLEWNIYPFHFSDGDNYVTDNDHCMQLLEKWLIPYSNIFCYGQVAGFYGSGKFLQDLDEHFHNEEDLITSHINDKDEIYNSIKEFLGKGK